VSEDLQSSKRKFRTLSFGKVRLTEINVDLLLGLRLMSTAGFLHRKPEVSAPARTGMRIMAAHFTRATQLASAVLAIAQCRVSVSVTSQCSVELGGRIKLVFGKDRGVGTGEAGSAAAPPSFGAGSSAPPEVCRCGRLSVMIVYRLKSPAFVCFCFL